MTTDTSLTLPELLLAVAVTWDRRRRTVDRETEVYNLVHTGVPARLLELVGEQQRFKSEGSVGQGNQTRAPWIRVYDPAVSPSAQDGPYLVYLFSVDMERLYLSLGLGVTTFLQSFSERDRGLRELKGAVDLYRSRMGPSRLAGLTQERLRMDAPRGSLHEGYELGSIASIEYSVQDLPDESVLARDLRRITALYAQLLNDPVLPELDTIIGSVATLPTEQQIEARDLVPLPHSRSSRPRRPGQRRTPRPRLETPQIGVAGEQLVIRNEKERLENAGRPDLAARVLHVACNAACNCGHRREAPTAEDEMFPGYDVLSFDDDGRERFIEVKSSVGDQTAYFLTVNEWRAAERHLSQYWLYLVNGVFKKSVTILRMKDPTTLEREGRLTLEIDRYVAFVG